MAKCCGPRDPKDTAGRHPNGTREEKSDPTQAHDHEHAPGQGSLPAPSCHHPRAKASPRQGVDAAHGAHDHRAHTRATDHAHHDDDAAARCQHDHTHAHSDHHHHHPGEGTSPPTARAKGKLSFRIRGMDCAEEIAVLRREVGPLVGGGDKLAFDVLNGTMSVSDALPHGTSIATIEKAVAKTGMRAAHLSSQGERDASPFWQRRGRSLMTLLSGLFMLLGFLTHAVLAGSVLAVIGGEGLGSSEVVPLSARFLYAVAILCGAWFVAPKAWYALRTLRPDMNLLMLIAVAGAVGIGEWLEGASVAFLFALSLALESWSVGRARRAVETLLDLSPKSALLETSEGSYREVSPSEVAIGARFLVKPGERIPLDGKVVSGSSLVNQAPITGESVPVEKAPGDDLYAGTVNGDSALVVQNTKAAGDTTLAHIVRMVADSQSRRGPAEQWVERFAQIYTPLVLAFALGVLFIPPLFFAGAWDLWFYRALVLLVIACPCALVISTPVSIVAAIAAAARHGVLVKGGAALEVPAKLVTIALDKTGTLTTGRPKVVKVVPMNGHDERELLERVAALEVGSTHPLAAAILQYTESQGIAPLRAEKFRTISGKGAEGIVDGRKFWVGSHRLLTEVGHETSALRENLSELARSGHSVVIVGNDDHVCGFITLADSVRPEAREAIGAIKAAGISRILILTGDNEPTAKAVAEATGVDGYHAELLPADKVALLEKLLAQDLSVAMVGDGVNDAPALARASLGIAMGAAGSDTAIESADIALMSDDLSKIAWIIHHARRTLRVIHQNIAFSLVVKASFVVLSFAGYATLWAAIAADMGASLLVVINGLRLLKDQSFGDKV